MPNINVSCRVIDKKRREHLLFLSPAVNSFFDRPQTLLKQLPGRRAGAMVFLFLCLGGANVVRGEAMLELFNVKWSDLTAKMPEIAEAGYDSLWVPNPAKGDTGAFSVGYDPFDRFDLGNLNQRGSISTQWGTEAQLIQMVQTAHRFGIRVYFDNVMNHNGGTVPGFNASTPTNYYPAMVPADFHLQTVAGGFFQNWPSLSSSDPTESLYGGNDYCDEWRVQNYSLLGLVDIANEPGTVNDNFGSTPASTITKPYYIRQPTNTTYYMDTNGPLLGAGWGLFGWRPFNGTNGEPVPEDASIFLCRAVMWTLYTTKGDGFRLDAVKHVPSDFFGNNTGGSTFSDDPSFSGYTGAIQAMYDWVHGYGNNVTGNGYVETDGNRNSLFDTETPRNDAMIFGEHVSTPPSYLEYLEVGMRLCNQPLYSRFYNITSDGYSGMDQRDFAPPAEQPCGEGPFPCYSTYQAVNFSMTQDGGSSGGPYSQLEDAYDFMHEGLPMFYSDGFNHSGPPTYFPSSSVTFYTTNSYLGEFGDNRMPDVAYTHNQLARGGTWSRWSDFNVVAFERYDYRDGADANPQDQDVVLFGENDDFGFPGDITFDDGVARASDGYYGVASNGSTAVSNSRNVGLVVGFPPGSVLVQLSSSGQAWGGNRAYKKLLVHGATTSMSAAQSSATAADPTQRLIYVGGQTLASGGGAIELTIPSGAWVMYGYQWPQASQANPSTNAIILRQGGVEAPRITVYRHDGVNGDPNFNPLFPFKMRGSVDAYGNVIGGANISNLTYAIDIPVVTNALFDILVRCDASSANALVKLDGGMDLNRQMGLGPTNNNSGLAPTNFPDFRDNKPGYADDVLVGYEQTAFEFRNGPEKFAAKNTLSNNIVSLGAETYYYTVGGGSNIVYGSGYGQAVAQTATWIYHDPYAPSTANAPYNAATQRNPANPANGESADIYVKVGYSGDANTCYIYYTTDGSNPEGAFGMGKGTTQTVPAFWVTHDSGDNTIDWWKGTIPALPSGTQVRYKVGIFNGGSYGFSVNDPADWPSIQPISDAETTGAKLFGLTQNAITNFNPTAAVVWLHNDLNPSNTVIGLQTGFHILRARVFLPRSNRSGVYNTFLQTFYYDAAPPAGAIVAPAPDGSTITNQNYTIVIRGDSSTTEADVNIQDSNTNNDDINTGQPNGNGNDTNGNPIFVAATPVTPNAVLSLQNPNYPLEFHFNYVNVPNSGPATITVRLKELTTAIYTNRYTTLTRNVNTVAPTQVIAVSNPSVDGEIVTLGDGNPFTIQACFTTNLPNIHSTAFWTININGVPQPRSDPVTHAPFYFLGGNACGPGMGLLSYSWNNPVIGTNEIQVVYSDGIVLSDAKAVIIAPPLLITGLGDNNQLLVWDSAPGINYQVLATTNLLQPFEPISGIIPSGGLSTFYTDTANSPQAPQKFYEIEVITNTP